LTDLLRETCGEAVLDDPTKFSFRARASDSGSSSNSAASSITTRSRWRG